MEMILSLGLLLGFFCQDSAKTENSSLELSLKSDQAEVGLGENIQLEISLKNGGDRDQEVASLLLEKRSLSLEILLPEAKAPFQYTRTQTDPHVAERLSLPVFSLKKGNAVNMCVRIPAIAVGDIQITAIYRGGDAEVRSSSTKVSVGKSSRGDHLSAIVEIRNPKDQKVEAVSFQLLPAAAPLNVINFIQLASSGFYDGMIFHRIIRGSWIQSGCPYGLGIGGPGYAVDSEAEGQVEKHIPGTLSIAGFEKTGYTGSQFFVTLGTIPTLDGKFTVVGRVSSEDKMKFLKTLGRVDVDKNNDRPRKDVELVRIRIVVE